MRLTLVCSSMNCGGAERVMSVLAAGWVERGHQVTLLTLDSGPSFFELSPFVCHCALHLAGESLGAIQAVRHNLRRIIVLRNALRASRPDVVVSFIDKTNIRTKLATIGLGVPTILCEHSDPACLQVGPIWSMLRILTYPFASAVTFLTQNVLDDFYWLVGAKGFLMPNPVLVPPGEPAAANGTDRRTVIAMGRLQSHKGFAYLLRAFAKVVPQHADWNLVILGEGPQREELQQMVNSLGLSGRVEFPGQVRDPFCLLRRADLFVLSSHFEGLPCALAEAMACGLPVISFNCRSGPAELIRDGIDGLLVPAGDVEALAGAMDRLMGNARERARLAARAPEVLQRYNLATILSRWDDLFRAVRERVALPATIPSPWQLPNS